MLKVYLEFLEETLGKKGEDSRTQTDPETENLVRQILNSFNINEQRLIGQNRLKNISVEDIPRFTEAMLTYFFLVASDGGAKAYVDVMRYYYEKSEQARKMIEEGALLRRDGVEELLHMVLNNKAPQIALEQQMNDETLNLKQRTAAAVAICEEKDLRKLPGVLRFFQSLPAYKGRTTIDEYARAVADNLHKFGPEAVDIIMQTLLTCHKDLTYHLFRTVGALGLPALNWIQRQMDNPVLKDGDWFRLCNCLGHLARKHHGALELLGQIVEREETYSQFAIEQLGKIGGDPTIKDTVKEILLKNLNHNMTQIRAKVISALANYPCNQGMRAAKEAIMSRVPDLKLAGAEYLARRHDEDGLDVLLSYARCADRTLVRKAGYALNRVGKRAMDEIKELLHESLSLGEKEALVYALSFMKTQPQRTEAALVTARLLVEDLDSSLANTCVQTLRELQVSGSELRRVLEREGEHPRVKNLITFLYHGGLVGKKKSSYGQGLLEEI